MVLAKRIRAHRVRLPNRKKTAKKVDKRQQPLHLTAKQQDDILLWFQVLLYVIIVYVLITDVYMILYVVARTF
jgi:hypothetical protein